MPGCQCSCNQWLLNYDHHNASCHVQAYNTFDMPVSAAFPQSCCIDREQFDTILEMGKFKTQASWGGDPMAGVETRTKSAFTRTFNKQVCRFRGGTACDVCQAL